MRFEEFVQYVLHVARHTNRRLDHHWRPQYELCQPCHMNYDFIGHYETIADDAARVLRRIANNTDADVRFPATDPDSRNRNSREVLRKFYANVSVRNVLRLLQLYKKDYETFGYDIPDEIRRKVNVTGDRI